MKLLLLEKEKAEMGTLPLYLFTIILI